MSRLVYTRLVPSYSCYCNGNAVASWRVMEREETKEDEKRHIRRRMGTQLWVTTKLYARTCHAQAALAWVATLKRRNAWKSTFCLCGDRTAKRMYSGLW